MAEQKVKAQEVAVEPQHTKEQFLSSPKYADSLDVISALLEDEKMYSVSQVDQLLTEFYDREVQ